MATPRPSCTLIFDIDEALATEQTRLEVRRCYSHVGSTVIRTHPDSGSDAKPNTMHLLAKLGNHRYLHSDDEGADELWKSSIEHWFYNEFHTVCNNMRIYNRRQREIGNVELRFEWLECELENGALRVAFHLDTTCSVPPEKSTLLTAVRTALNDGTLGTDVVKVSMPTESSWTEQVARGEIAVKEREEREREAEEAAQEQEAKAAAEHDAEDRFLESPELVQAEHAEDDEEEFTRPALEEEVPDFEVNYRMWDIEYADGRHRAFDSESMTFADEGACA